MKTKIYFLPGLMTDERLWKELFCLFDDSYELIHVKIPLKRTFDEILEALCFKEEKINLLGFSLGGYVAAYFACKYPHRINKLFILASSPSSMYKDEIIKRSLAIEFTKKHGFKNLSAKKVISLLEEKNNKNTKLIKLVQDMYKDEGAYVFELQMKATLLRKDLLQELIRLNTSIYFFYSKHDRLLNHNSLLTLQEEHKKARFIINNGTSHMLPLEEPKKLHTLILEWINEKN
ncbi:MAG: hypothetical protein COA66_04495 [Arcobacter sp.]|nr:MAG: hypothetical protein COA66_04495 [Arcobacter sp.]